ncbi:hypothetical protein [Aquimarina sp. 2201CG14-23]|uniref:hypothetical protein n=1 Tax=Aquimarina mycalae TaxID=3040073 RepID=UPI002478044A|nr:hypothetical protein [Aquimarina sp. 2201CG14-23]MDH7447170.1 hypothetical protein [Aquimarina sp. 2201CG14-23]
MGALTKLTGQKKMEAKWSFIIPGTLLIFGFILLILYSIISEPHWTTVLSTLSMVMLASFSVGALIGFIFGIPRTLQENITEGVKSNSNLEQLSDWLTKIIVGVGLVESKEVFELIGGLAEKLSSGFTNAPLGYSIIASTLIFYFFGGFFISYLWSRILLERIFMENMDTERRIAALEETKDIQDEINELQSNYSKESLKSIIDKSLEQTKDAKKQTNIFGKIIGVAYDKLDYSSINILANEYDSKLQISANTWSDIALANLNLYNSSHNKIYADGVNLACNRSIELLHNYGTPQMIKIYLTLVIYKKAKDENNPEKIDQTRKSVENIIKEINGLDTITAYEAYAYMLKNDTTIFGKYNELFRTDFKVACETLKDRYLEHLKTSKAGK